MSGSRSAWLALGVGILLLTILRKRSFARILMILFGIFLLLALFHSALQFVDDTHISYVGRNNLLHDGGVSQRLLMLERGYELWRGSPLFGTGLGGFLHYQIGLGSHQTMHNTAGWIAVEMGTVGLLLFALFFINAVSWLWKYQRKENIKRNNYYLMGLTVLCALVAASLGMEAMYQRHVWFFVGFALSVRPKRLTT